MGPLVLPDPSDRKARNRAFAIRQKIPKGTALPGEAQWLTEYDAAKSRSSGKNAEKATRSRMAPTGPGPAPEAPPSAPPSTFASGSSKKIMHVEEHTQAVQASGDPTVIAAAMAAATAREEGRRYDYLLEAAVGSQRFVIDKLLERNGALEQAQIAMMETIRVQYIARAQAEIDAMNSTANAEKLASESESGEMTPAKLMEQLATVLPLIQGFMKQNGAPKP